MDYLRAFILGGTICAIGQLLIDKTRLTPARILVIFVTIGAVLTGLGLYDHLVTLGGAGATVPLTGFGYVLTKGAIKDVNSIGLLGALTGGVKAAAAGITAALFFGYIISIVAKPKPKS
ncbi:MAG: stage V sporulation protein AE [Deltaproteobacteria bacterium]